MSKKKHGGKMRIDPARLVSQAGETGDCRTSGEPGTSSPPVEGFHPKPTREEIAHLAYQIWEARGRPAGDGREDWLEAEHQLCNGIRNPLISWVANERADDNGECCSRPECQVGRVEHSGSAGFRDTKAGPEQAREQEECKGARQASPSIRERMVDIGRGNQQAGRQGH